MTELTPAGGYVPSESFESGRVTVVSADESKVVLGTEAGTIEIVGDDGRTTVEFDAEITDLAIGNRLYALVDGTISALSAAGTRVWSVELPAARKLAALPGPNVLGVVTDDKLLGFDGETGGQEFEVERPYADVTDEPGFFGADGAFVLVAWSFLAVRNLDGTERFDLNLDGAIESAGIVDETVVVSLKDERVIGVHAMTGERQWERELSVTDLPDRGEETLLFTADDQLVSLTANGTYATVDELPGGDVYPASNGDLFCTITDGTVGVYCASGDPTESLSVSVAEDELVSGTTESIDLTVRNESDQLVAAALRADGDGIALSETDHAVKLAPGESMTQTIGVERITAEETADITIDADDDHLTSISLSVDDYSDGPLAIETEIDAITDGIAALTVEVRNEGDVPLTSVSVSPGDARYGRLAPDESASATVEVPFDPNAVVPISVQADDAETEHEATVSREGIVVEVEPTPDDFVDVRVENRTEALLADDLVVTGNAFDSDIERPVELPENGTFVFALRPDAGTVEATLEGLGISQSSRFRPKNNDAAGYRDQATERPSEVDGKRAKSTDAYSSDVSATASTSQAIPDDNRAGPSDDNRVGTSDDNRAGTSEENRAGPTGERTGSETETARTNEVGEKNEAADAGLSAERTVAPTDPSRTQTVQEQLVISNETEETAEDVTVDILGEETSVGEIRSGDRVTVERLHTVTEVGDVTLPAATVTAGNVSRARIGEQTLTVTPAEFAVEAELDATDGDHRFRATLTNHRDVACEVSRIGIRDIGVWNTEECRVPPGQTVEWSRRIDAPDPSIGTTAAAVKYAFADGEPNRWLTLARNSTTAAADSDNFAALAVTVGEETCISGGYGSVVLNVENRSGSPVTDVSVEATGEDVSDLMYGGGESVEELGPGGQFTHFVDVETEGPEATISVVLSTDEETETELMLEGPAPADEDDWSADALDAWSVEREDAAESEESARISTKFERS